MHDRDERTLYARQRDRIAELEVALVRERERREAARADAELLWANCRVIYFPDPAGSYPLEHNMRACGTKDSRADIEAALRIDAARKEQP